jgi:hypothetical protein
VASISRRTGSVRTDVQIRLRAGGGHGKRLAVATNLARQELTVGFGSNRASCLRRGREPCAETHDAWLEDSRYLNMDLLSEQKKHAMKIAA